MKQKIKEDQSIDILKRVAKRVEETTVDIGEMKRSLRFVNLRLGQVEHNTELMKVDVEKMRTEVGGIKDEMTGLKADVGEMKVDIRKTREELEGTEDRLGKRISHVADLITISLGQKFGKMEKRIQKIEHIQQTA